MNERKRWKKEEMPIMLKAFIVVRAKVPPKESDSVGDDDKEVLVRLDAEWHRGDTRTRFVQVSVHND